MDDYYFVPEGEIDGVRYFTVMLRDGDDPYEYNLTSDEIHEQYGVKL